MADKTSEQISVMMDGECELPEMELQLRRLIKDPDCQERWQRYHLVSDVLKSNLPEVVDHNFAERVKQAIAAAPPLVPSPAQVPSWYKPLTGFALAASVILTALFGLKLLTQPQTATDFEPARMADASAQSTQSATASPRELEARLSSYLVNHNEHASRNSVNGVLPYVRMVGYESRNR